MRPCFKSHALFVGSIEEVAGRDRRIHGSMRRLKHRVRSYAPKLLAVKEQFQAVAAVKRAPFSGKEQTASQEFKAQEPEITAASDIETA